MDSPWHLGLEADDRLALFQSEEKLRLAVRTLARIAGKACLLFCIVDDHVHVVVYCDRERAGRLARAILLALRVHAAVPFKPQVYIRHVENRHHLTRLVSYSLEQPSHHKLPVHPVLWTGSCLSDLIGARSIGALGVPLTRVLPRFKLADAMPLVGLEPRDVVAADDRTMREAGAARLAMAAAAALSADPKLQGHRKEVEEARAAAAVLAKTAGIATRETASALDVAMRTVQRLSASQPPTAVLGAVRVRLALENAVASSLRGTVR